MGIIPGSRARYDAANLEESEFALAVSPCPRIDAPNRAMAQVHPAVSDRDELTETLTFGWAIALAISVALVMYISGSWA